MIYELARFLADAYLDEERRRNSVYFGLHANILVRDQVARPRRH